MIKENVIEKFKIGICDDERKMREKIHQLCDVVMFRKNVEYKCIDFCDGREVLQYKHSIDLLILDIKMPRMSGIAVKRKLQERKEDTIIIYVTDYEDAIIDAFGIHVYGFVFITCCILYRNKNFVEV